MEDRHLGKAELGMSTKGANDTKPLTRGHLFYPHTNEPFQTSQSALPSLPGHMEAKRYPAIDLPYLPTAVLTF